MTEMVYGAGPAAIREPALPRWWLTADKWSLGAVLLLCAIGLLLGLAGSVPLAERNGLGSYYYVIRQAAFGGLALIVLISVSMLPPHAVRRLGVLGFGIAFIAVALLPLFGTDFGKGAVRWYSLGLGSLQPSEFLKPCFVVLTAWLMAAAHKRDAPPGLLWSFLLCAVIVLMLALQPDYGQACLILFGWAVMYFVAGAPMVFLLGLLGLVGIGGFVAYHGSEHVAKRIDGFLSPDLDPTSQIGQAANAIREGGLMGVGVGEGVVKWSLPDAHTDFIIAVAAEEFGLILVLVILGLYARIVLGSLLRLRRERDLFIRLAGTGLVAIFGAQALINIGVAARLLPAKGMTLPFISSGGSSLLASGLAMGMLIALTCRRPQGTLSDVLALSRHRRPG